MATITVTNLGDSGPGSLRDAISTASSDDTITFDASLAGGTLTLTSGELDITKNLTIKGELDGNGTPDITISGNNASRVFQFENAITATLDGLVIRGGSSGSAGPVDNGGGIAVGQQDSLTLKNSKVTDNQGYSGGGIYAPFGSSVILIDTSVFANSSDHGGGGIFSDGGLRLINTTISNNDSASEGGGIDLGLLGSLVLTNGTLAGNSSGGNGGGIYGAVGNGFSLYNSTLTGNYAAGAGGGIYSVGNGGVGGAILLFNSIVAGNAAYGSGTDLDLDNSPLVLHGNNILGSTPANALTFGSYTKIDGTSQAALETVFVRVDHNPHTGVLSGVLADNGGAVRTVAINPGGIAYNGGSNAALPPDTFDLNNNGNTTEPLPVDARGFARVSGGTVDIGAFEQQPGTNFVVTTLADNPYDGGTLAQELAEGNGLSLRQALGLANQDPTSFDSIQFDPSLIGGSTHGVNDGVLLLTNGQLTINGNVTIEGDINGDQTPDITIDGQSNSRDLAITGGNVGIDGLTITGGYAFVHGGGVSLGHGGYGPANVAISHSIISNNSALYGGGISVDAGDSLQLTNSMVSGNSAFYVGGGIASKGTLALRDTTVSGNSSGYIGGGIANHYAGALTVVNSTISNNTITNGSPGFIYDSAGAGLYNAGSAALVNTTIAGNKGAYAGGGVYNSGGLTLTNVTIANNSAYNGGGLSNAPCGCGYATVNDTTFTGNYAKQFGGGIYNANGTVTLTNTIVAGNGTGYHGPDILTGPSGITNYAGVNLFSQTGIGSGTDIVQPDLTQVFANLTTIDPDGVPSSGDEFQAGTLANNGGSVETVAIKVRGSAQNTGSTADLPPDSFDLNNNADNGEALPVDARGAPRVFGSAVDIGAFEAQMPVAKNDFNDDGKSDLLWQNADGRPAIWNLNGTAIIGGGLISNPGASWTVEASGDFNHDNKADVILQNSDGLPQIWLMNGTSVTSTVTLANSGPPWHVIATGDFNADGNTDILWQSTDGLGDIWLMNGTSIIGAAPLAVNPGPTWHMIGAGDVNGDGNADILWQNDDGRPAIWEMNGVNVIGGGFPGINPGPAWHAIGLGDFNGDGKADILWQNADGTPGIWELNGTSVIGGGLLPNVGPAWHVIGPSDFNGDGKADILWQNNDGTPAVWEMNGTTIIGGGLLPNVGPSWHVKDDGPISPDPAGAGSQPALHLSTPDGTNAAPIGSAPQFDPTSMRQLHAGAG